MKLLSVNVSGPKPILYRGATVSTGIFKLPVQGRVVVRRLGIEGDTQVDRRIHGGPDKAVYAYPHEHYAHWSRELERKDFEFGQFGENLTTQGLLEHEIRVGDVFQVGAAWLQVTEPRMPCFKLMARMNNFRFAKPFLASGRTGFYLRVVKEGEIGAGDSIRRLTSKTSQPTIREVVERFAKTERTAQ